MAAISYHETLDNVQAIEWPQPDPPCVAPSPGRRAARPIYAVAEDASGSIVFPLRRARGRLEALVDQPAIWRPLGTPYASADSLMIALARDLASKTAHVVLDGLPDEDGTARQLERAFVKSGWLVVRETGEIGDGARPRYRLRCWRKRDPRNWPALAGHKFRALVSRQRRG